MSRETTFERDLHPSRDRETLGPILSQLCERLSQDLVNKGYLGRTIGIRVRYGNFQSLTRDITLALPTNDPQTIRHAARRCLRRIDLARSLRLLGVRVSNLQSAEDQFQASLKNSNEGDQGILDLG